MYCNKFLLLAFLANACLGNPIALSTGSDFDSPRSNNTVSPRSSGNPGFYFCTQSNWQGECDWIPLTIMNIGLTWKTGWEGSIGPDQGVVCRVYNDMSCLANWVDGIRYPGIADLHNSQALQKLGTPRCVQCMKG